MTTYLIDYSATWVGFATLGAGDRLIVTPSGSLVLPGSGFDLRGTAAAGVALAGFAWLNRIAVEGATSFTLGATGQWISDVQDAALTLGAGARASLAGSLTALQGTGAAITGAAVRLDIGGAITAETGLSVTGRGARIAITGTVSGSTQGVVLAGGEATLSNLGTIRGGVAVSGDAGGAVSVHLTNGGTLEGGLTATLGRGESGLWLDNAGRFLGNLHSGASADTVTGTGEITGHVWMGAGNDRFAGRVTGDLDMGTGNDIVDARGHAVGGVVRDGGGGDLYLVDGAVTIEDSGLGQDTVQAWVDWTLTPGLEVLELQGSALRGTGNGLANRLTGTEAANLLEGGAGTDTLQGGAGNDTLRGGLGADRLEGGDGDDRLNGGAGRDQLAGGSGADTFVFARGETGATAATADVITDFSAGDLIDLRTLGGLTLVDGLSGHARELAVTTLGPDTLVVWDLDGDGRADGAVRLSGTPVLTEADFLLQ